MSDEVEPGEQRETREQPLRRGEPILWALVAIAIVALTSAATVSLLRADRGPRPAFLEAPASSASGRTAAAPRRTSATLLAGSGSNLPLTRALAIAFMERHPGEKVVVTESIGSSGGIRAVRDGAVDVGLIARPLSEQEMGPDLVVTPYARVPVVVAANPTAGDACVASGSLAGMWSGEGERSRWSDGSPVVVLQRERGDSSFLAVSRAHPALGVENERAYGERRWRVLYDDRSMQEALMSTEGAVGIFDLGAIVAQRLPIKVLCVDGVTPSVEAVVSGRYPYSKDLAFVTRATEQGPQRAVIDFVLSPEGRAIIAGLGCAPLPIAPSGGAR